MVGGETPRNLDLFIYLFGGAGQESFLILILLAVYETEQSTTVGGPLLLA